MTSDETPHRDRREHGGSNPRPDDDALARRTEAERVEAGLDPYDPDDIPAATDSPPQADPGADDTYRDEVAEVDRQTSTGELRPLTDDNPFPPTSYDRS
jgi:hypothetical protein